MQGFGFGFEGLALRVHSGLTKVECQHRFRVQDQGVGFRVSRLGVRVQGGLKGVQ